VGLNYRRAFASMIDEVKRRRTLGFDLRYADVFVRAGIQGDMKHHTLTHTHTHTHTHTTAVSRLDPAPVPP